MKNSGLFLNMAKWCFWGVCFFEVLILKGLFLVCLALFESVKNACFPKVLRFFWGGSLLFIWVWKVLVFLCFLCLFFFFVLLLFLFCLLCSWLCGWMLLFCFFGIFFGCFFVVLFFLFVLEGLRVR